jgi:hypothetical protein
LGTVIVGGYIYRKERELLVGGKIYMINGCKSCTVGRPRYRWQGTAERTLGNCIVKDLTS